MLLACRGRYHPTQWRNLPKLFPHGIRGQADNDAVRDRASFFVRLLGFSLGGVILGQSAGFALGTWRSGRILRSEGNYDNIERVMKKVQRDVMEQMRAQRGGPAMEGTADGKHEPMPGNARRKIQSLPPVPDGSSQPTQRDDTSDFYGRKRMDDAENSRLSRVFEQDKPFGTVDRSIPSRSDSNRLGTDADAWNEQAANSSVSSSSSNAQDTRAYTHALRWILVLTTCAAAPRKQSRWEELRGQRGQSDSAWEKIRQDSARTQLNSAQPADATQDSFAADSRRPASESFREDAKMPTPSSKLSDRERQRLEYEKMFEKERRGID